MIKHVIADLAPMREKRAELEANPNEVEAILSAGNQTAQFKASETMREVRESLGL